MVITELDKPLTAEDARKISLNNKDDSADRMHFRHLMVSIKEQASFGHTRYISSSAIKDFIPSERVQNHLRNLGYKVTQKRAYIWDSNEKKYSDRPSLNQEGREQFFLEITWG